MKMTTAIALTRPLNEMYTMSLAMTLYMVGIPMVVVLVSTCAVLAVAFCPQRLRSAGWCRFAFANRERFARTVGVLCAIIVPVSFRWIANLTARAGARYEFLQRIQDGLKGANVIGRWATGLLIVDVGLAAAFVGVFAYLWVRMTGNVLGKACGLAGPEGHSPASSLQDK